MFTAKRKSLFDLPKRVKNTTSVGDGKYDKLFEKQVEELNPFIEFGFRDLTDSHDDENFSYEKEKSKTLSGNMALKYNSSGTALINRFVDQFASTSKYLGERDFVEISNDMEVLWGIDKELTMKFVLYLRMITRPTKLVDGIELPTQRGAGLKHESIMRMIWIGVKEPKVFADNLALFVSAGSWQDIFKMLSYDLQYNGWENKVLDWDFIGRIILSGLANPETTNLVRKYLPQIKANSKCTTLASQANNMIGKWITHILFDGVGTYEDYRRMKSKGTAHEWQQLISQGKHELINFDSIHGRALSLLVTGKYLDNQNLTDKYTKWIMSKPIAKFTGFPHELGLKAMRSQSSLHLEHTINAQFNGLVEMAKINLDNTNFRPFSVLDTSGSMDSLMYVGGGKVGKMRSIDVAHSSALFFNEMVSKDSPFYNRYLVFGHKAEMAEFTGRGFYSEMKHGTRGGYGSTNIQSVFDFFVKFRQLNPNVSEDLIPNFLILFSDGEFNNTNQATKTNFEVGRQKLTEYYSKEFCENFGICLVDLPNNFYYNKPMTKFETFDDSKNTYYFAGYDLSPLSFLFGVGSAANKDGSVKTATVPKSAEELFIITMDQDLLNLVKVE